MKQIVLFHAHGLGAFDFSQLAPDHLTQLDKLAERRKCVICASVFLTRSNFVTVANVLSEFAKLQSEGGVRNILGFAIEGPVLGPNGGTPTGSVWRPTGAQWREIARWFPLGVKYIVIAPDIVSLGDNICSELTFSDLLDLIYGSGGRIAVGHFGAPSAEESARRFEKVLSYIEARYEPSPYLILTDHLFNDMPRSFRHAFRTPFERAARLAELEKHTGGWTDQSLPGLLGPVPAAILRAAKHGRLTPALNFDGGHVDLAICRHVIDYLGDGRVIAMTDHTEVDHLAGEPLSMDGETGLLYRYDGVLAASAVTPEAQRRNMSSMGMTEAAIDLAFNQTPLSALSFAPCRRRFDATQP
jgi:N-acetylglucosamine-6-phosphate deacetylase